MVWSSMTWKWPIPVLFCGMNHQKYKFSLISVSFSVGGCWGQNMLLFWKLVDETQIPQSQEYTDTFKQNLTCTFLSIRGNLKYTLCHEGPCRFPSVTKVWAIRLGFVLIIARTIEDQGHSFPQEQFCMVSQYSKSPIGKQVSSIFYLNPDFVKLTRHKSIRLGNFIDVSLILKWDILSSMTNVLVPILRKFQALH